MWLSDETFRTVVASTPLVSIDLVVTKEDGKVLLGQRLNRPAQGFWFVPGGRILKGESLNQAFERLTEHELGVMFSRAKARLLGVYEHFYADSVFGSGDSSDTHYIVLGYQLTLSPGDSVDPPLIQHGKYRWWSVEDMQCSLEVHANTRAFLGSLT